MRSYIQKKVYKKCSVCNKDLKQDDIYYCPNESELDFCIECFKKHKCSESMK